MSLKPLPESKVEDLQENHPDHLDDIALYLNFDMIGSPNYIRGVYQLNQNAPTGTAQITKLLTDYFDSHDLYWEPIRIGGRSDHAPFMRAGIAVDGLFSGAENVLSRAQARAYGHARGGIATDPCYHQACDTIENVSEEALRPIQKIKYTREGVKLALQKEQK
ncbi:M28 family peptidase [Chloroflexi bacterium TSY]|nr:M28 family peptidase [Chloroflexi bacterium TSY]